MSPTDRHVWALHADVFEFARASALGRFRVQYKAYPGGLVVIALVLEGTKSAGAPEQAREPA